MKATWDEEVFSIKEEIASVTATVQSEAKKGEYMAKELNGQIMKALGKEQNLEN